MDANEKTLNTFATRVRQMILQYEELKGENSELYDLVDQREKEIETLKAQLRQAQSDYNSLKMAKMITISDGDMESAQKRISKLIRDVNKCKLITDTVNEYAQIVKKKKSDKDILYMAMLEIALKYKKDGVRNDTAPYIDILGKLTAEIEDTLKK